MAVDSIILGLMLTLPGNFGNGQDLSMTQLSDMQSMKASGVGHATHSGLLI